MPEVAGRLASASSVCVCGAAPPGSAGEKTVPTRSASTNCPVPGVPVVIVMSTLALMSAPTPMSPLPLVSSSQAAIPKLSVAAKRPDANCLHVNRFIAPSLQ